MKADAWGMTAGRGTHDEASSSFVRKARQNEACNVWVVSILSGTSPVCPLLRE
ncbi:MAG: hypothetical protein GKR93_01760 [Gammaproteobacteria bacterium]|nr:hypothetical protein [Gammaproteobacteria bacterium]